MLKSNVSHFVNKTLSEELCKKKVILAPVLYDIKLDFKSNTSYIELTSNNLRKLKQKRKLYNSKQRQGRCEETGNYDNKYTIRSENTAHERVNVYENEVNWKLKKPKKLVPYNQGKSTRINASTLEEYSEACDRDNYQENPSLLTKISKDSGLSSISFISSIDKKIDRIKKLDESVEKKIINENLNISKMKLPLISLGITPRTSLISNKQRTVDFSHNDEVNVTAEKPNHTIKTFHTPRLKKIELDKKELYHRKANIKPLILSKVTEVTCKDFVISSYGYDSRLDFIQRIIQDNEVGSQQESVQKSIQKCKLWLEKYF